MAKALKFTSKQYKEAVDYFKQKINLPTKRWNDLEGAMHTRAFTVAGAMREDILCDFRNAVEKAIANGETLQDFRDRFYDIASKWRESDPSFDEKMQKPKYGAWRSKVIYQTNILTSAAAAQERQARSMPDVFTHAKYVCMMMPTSREQHKAWNGTVLPLNDPWWETHSPPNGFGCLCEKEFISKYEMDAGLEKTTKAPTAPDDTTNIGENWDYSIGDADVGKIQETKAEKEWDIVSQKGLWEDAKTTKVNTSNPMPIPKKTEYTEDIKKFSDNFMNRLKEEFKDDPNASFNENSMTILKNIGGFNYPIYVNPSVVGKHFLTKDGNKNNEWKPDRTKLINYFIETLKTPSDYRFQFEKSLKTGKSSISLLLIGIFGNEKKVKPLKFIVKGVGGRFQMWTAYRTEDVLKKGIEGSLGKK
ncbi:MAG: phage head morphogenesis protein [Fibrobacter sp.]|nr:phage head morphogenesis protein [Fibrobacter sp.]